MSAEPAYRNRIKELRYVSAGELAVHPKNWRLHPPEQRSALLAAMEMNGVVDAVVAYESERNGGRLTLIDGHLRRELLDQEVPVLITDLDDEEADRQLAAHDVLTTMAVPDEDELGALLDDAMEGMPRDLLLAIDPDLEGHETVTAEGTALAGAKYEILPQLDEGYDYVVVFCVRDTEFAWLETVLELPTRKDRKKIGLSHVLTAQEFRERWERRNGQEGT